MALAHDEVVTPVLQRKATTIGHDARSEPHVVRVDERASIAPAVGGAQVDGVGACAHLEGRLIGYDTLRLPLGVEMLLPPRCSPVLVEHPRRVGAAGLCGVRAELQGVRKGQPKSLGLRVQQRGAHPRMHRFLFQQVQGHEGRHALGGRRALPEPHLAPVGGADRLHEGRRVRLQVVHRHHPAAHVQSGHDALGDTAAVEALLRAELAQQPEGLAQVRVPKKFAAARRAPLGQHGRRTSSRAMSEPGRAIAPALSRTIGDREALLGQLNGRRQDRGELQPAPARDGGLPSRGRAWHGHAQGAERRKLLPACHLRVRPHGLQRQAQGRAPATLQALHLLRGAVEEEGEGVAAYARTARLGHIERRGRGHAGIRGGAAGLQDAHPRFAGQRLARGDHAPPPIDRSAPRVEGEAGGHRGGGRHLAQQRSN
mmetsp:Transcript_58554/g.151347  ORF Transcript_58554/g.151347 Transcript_58554/m.151347 type:complete len:427 (-) Transcript_58554:55-1335(-)